MSASNDGGPAFPGSLPLRTTVAGIPAEFPTHQGMSLRDYFAAKIVAALYSNPTTVSKAVANSGGSYKLVMQRWAVEAYEQADAMLAERKKGESQ